MNVILAVLGTFIVTTAGNVWMAHYYIRLGFRLDRDDRALDPGETTGSLEAVTAAAVGESSGRHALPEFSDAEQTVVMPAVGEVPA